MSADDETKTTTVFDGKQENYGKYRMKLRGEFCAKGIQSALGSKFKDVLPATEDATSQTVKQKEAVKSNIGGMGILIKTNKHKLPLGYLHRFIALLVFNPDFYTDTYGGSADLKNMGVATDDGANMHSG